MRRLCLLSLLFTPLAAPAADLAADLDRLAAEARKTWNVPGCAVAVVKGDDVLLLKGYGVKQLDKPEDAVTPDTLFGIGSLTKGITAAALAKLASDGKLSWDDHVRKHVPFFKLADALADRDVTLRDLLSHRTGLVGHDLLWHGAPWSLEETVRRMAHLEPAVSFRSQYHYHNLTYITLGFAIASASGKQWQEYVRQDLFGPLGMSNVVFTRSDMIRAKDHSSPHVLSPDGSKVEVIDWYNDDRQIRASGSVKASVRDMERWLRFQLAGGSWEGKPLIARAQFAEMHRSQIVVPVRPIHEREAGTTQAGYGLGWHLRDHRGHFFLEHGGSVDGFQVYQCLAPKQKVGVVVLGNLGGSNMPPALCYALLDRVLELPAKDWNTPFKELQQRERAARKKRQEEWLARRRPGTKPSTELSAYAGSYVHPAYGKVEVRHDHKALSLRWSSFDTPLKHFHLDTFTVEAKGRIHGEPATFTLGPEGDVVRLRFLGQEFRRERQ